MLFIITQKVCAINYFFLVEVFSFISLLPCQNGGSQAIPSNPTHVFNLSVNMTAKIQMRKRGK